MIKNPIPVIFHSFNPDVPSQGFWDQFQLQDIFSFDIDASNIFYYETGYLIDAEPVQNGCILIIPARSQIDYIDQINEQINKWPWVILVIAGDEENVFPIEKLHHPNMITYLMSPHFDKDLNKIDRFIGEGYTPHTKEYLGDKITKSLDIFFAGQRNHIRREECLDGLRELDPKAMSISIIETGGFAQGLERDDYISQLASAKIVPCPSGPATPDTFRFYETLELGGVPLADVKTPEHEDLRYWQRLFGQEELPFPLVSDWKHVGGHITPILKNWPRSANKCFSWWQQYKRSLQVQFTEDVRTVSHYELNEDNANIAKITALVCSSPIRRHPDTSMIIETIESVQSRLPEGSEIIVMFDGVRQEQEYLRSEYEEYVNRMLHWINDRNYISPLVFDEHMHQSGMTKEALKLVRTPTILFVEHDTPLIGDIDFNGIADVVIDGSANLIRLHHETHVLVEHEHMMLDTGPVELNGVPLMKTVQWSQRPHVASVEFYKKILQDHFSEHAKTMIEDVMHGVVHAPYVDRGRGAWLDFKLWMYTPSVDDMKRSTNLDGRGDEDKYGMVF